MKDPPTRLPNHLVDLVVCQLLADARHDMPQLRGEDEAVVIAIEDFERLTDLLLGVGVLHLAAIMVKNLGKTMVPLLLASTPLIMSYTSLSDGFWPSERITVPSSLVVIWPGCGC